MPLFLKYLFERAGPAVVQERIAAAHATQRGRVEFAISHLVAQPDIVTLRRGVFGGNVATRAFRDSKTSRPRATTDASAGLMPVISGDGGASEFRYAARSATCSSVGLVPCMVVTIDLRIWSSSRGIEPVQVHGPVARDSQERRDSLGGTIRPVAERVAQEAVGMAVGMAALAAHPAVVRQLGTREQPLAPVGRGQFGPGSQRDRRRAQPCRDLDDRDRVVQTVGDIGPTAIRARQHAPWAGVPRRCAAELDRGSP